MLITSVAVSDFTWNEELANANAIQQHLLARESGVVAHADCSARCRQAHAVGGDFYDFLRLPDGELGIALGDVAGKGLGAVGCESASNSQSRSAARASGA